MNQIRHMNISEQHGPNEVQIGVNMTSYRSKYSSLGFYYYSLECFIAIGQKKSEGGGVILFLPYVAYIVNSS